MARKISIKDAIHEALDQEMARDPSVILMGEDIVGGAGVLASIPSFDALTALESKRKIVTGGLPLGDRAFVFIVDAKSNEEVDALLRDLPMWGVLKWQVTPLQSFKGRARSA